MPGPPPDQTPATDAAPDPRVLALLAGATHRLVRSVDALAGEQWAAASGLPDWSRAHVVAHLALNAEALTGALRGVAAGERVPMYPSPEARDRDIADLADLAGATHPQLRDRLLGSVTAFADALAATPADRWGTSVERTPGGRTFAAGEVPGMRWREVEVHHVDLGTSYSPEGWSPEFGTHLVEAMVARDGHGRGCVLVATDLDRSWTIGNGGPAVTGPVAALGWWLTGRGDGAGLTSEGGDLPRMGAW